MHSQIIDEENWWLNLLNLVYLSPEPESPQLVWESLETKESYQLSIINYSL